MFETVYNGLKYYTAGTNGYVDVNDLAKIMIRLMDSDITEERFLINGENISYQELFTMMAESLQVNPPAKKAGKLASEIVWRTLKLKSILTGKKPLITKETARTANSTYNYSNEKIKKAIRFRFRPINETIEYTAKLFLEDVK
jgi:nucleoside-diphosphate-sugar epimerase